MASGKDEIFSLAIEYFLSNSKYGIVSKQQVFTITGVVSLTGARNLVNDQ